MAEAPGESAVSGDPALERARRIDRKVRQIRPDGWRGVQTREQVTKGGLYEILQEEAEVERIFLTITAQGEY